MSAGAPAIFAQPTGLDDKAIGFHTKNWFFSADAVKRSVDQVTRKALSRFGAFVRQGARGSIQESNTISSPGNPPHSHVGAQRRSINRRRKAQGVAPVKGGLQGIKDIWFAYEPQAQSVIVGPVKYNIVSFRTGTSEVLHGTVPSVLEFGGQVTQMMVESQGAPGEFVRANLRSRRRLAGRKIKYRTVTIRPRPYMIPALERELPKLPGMWADAIL